ncbi:MAG: anthranilate synthase component I family protein [Myxococcota bacterium]
MWAERIDPIDEVTTARLMSREPGFAWLDSHRPDARDGRYSFLAAWPDAEFSEPFGSSEPFRAIDRLGDPGGGVTLTGPKPNEVPRWIGFIAFDAFWSRPERGETRFKREDEPVVSFRRYPALVAVDHLDSSCWLIGDDEEACRTFRSRLEACVPGAETRTTIGELTVDDPEAHRAAIVRALEHIAHGDVYEVNLARRWSASFEGDPFALWAAMREASPVPLGAFLSTPRGAILACTMERFLRWYAESKALVTRPIKGTIRRGGDEAAATLLADPKERAEHSMVVDLMRNDLGRVAEIGSVRVDSPLAVEPFAGLFHLVSTVSCLTRPETTLTAILEATFPPGSVTGAPKLRALEIIEALEQHPRRAYCGAVGFIDRDGGVSLAVAIRTATVVDTEVQYWAGGGIVEASDPDREVAETELKARVFLDAVASLGGGHD